MTCVIAGSYFIYILHKCVYTLKTYTVFHY